jgi:asparagine synthase (glutamine-hydrolysing)
MISKGEVFNTNCDTEVLLRTCDVVNNFWADDIVGMFAFALWDRQKQTLMLGRDRMGIKPLYYIDTANAFIFSSEIKALLQYPDVAANLNESKVSEYIAFRNISGNETLFKGVLELEPGCLLKISTANPSPEIQKYWHETDKCPNMDNDPSTEHFFEDLFEESVRCRLISDVPLGTFNSGGVDSSLVTSIVKNLKKEDLHTFSVGFNEPTYDESPYAEVVAARLGTQHHKIIMSEQEYIENLDRTLWALEEPINHPHTVPLLLLCRLAKNYVTVVLTGEGADEVFAGYPRYQIPIFAQYSKIVPGFFHNVALKLAEKIGKRKLVKLLEESKHPLASALNCARFIPYADLDRIIPDRNDFIGARHDIFKAAGGRGVGFLNQLLLYERQTYLLSLLNRLDKVSMANGLEARVPFLDHRLVCWSRSLPDSKKIRLFLENKVIVKREASKRLPKTIVYRKKVGFGVPIAQWLNNNVGLGRYLDFLTDRTFKERGYFAHLEVEKLIGMHRQGLGDHSEALWALLNFELWCRKFVD